MAQYDFIIEGGRYFDGTGAPSSIRNLAIKDGRVARVTGEAIDHAEADRVIDASGKWVTPGFLDTQPVGIGAPWCDHGAGGQLFPEHDL
jgi:N-acyl-D-aspartate/D-glutamate deacylase